MVGWVSTFLQPLYQLDIDRRTLQSSQTYLNACLDMLLHDATKLLASNDGDAVEHGETMRKVYDSLRIIVLQYFHLEPRRKLCEDSCQQ